MYYYPPVPTHPGPDCPHTVSEALFPDEPLSVLWSHLGETWKLFLQDPGFRGFQQWLPEQESLITFCFQSQERTIGCRTAECPSLYALREIDMNLVDLYSLQIRNWGWGRMSLSTLTRTDLVSRYCGLSFMFCWYALLLVSFFPWDSVEKAISFLISPSLFYVPQNSLSPNVCRFYGSRRSRNVWMSVSKVRNVVFRQGPNQKVPISILDLTRVNFQALVKPGDSQASLGPGN